MATGENLTHDHIYLGYMTQKIQNSSDTTLIILSLNRFRNELYNLNRGKEQISPKKSMILESVASLNRENQGMKQISPEMLSVGSISLSMMQNLGYS